MILSSEPKAEGTAKPSFVSEHLERLHRENVETEEDFDDIRGAAAGIYAAGADTVSTEIHTPPSPAKEQPELVTAIDPRSDFCLHSCHDSLSRLPRARTPGD